MAEDASCRPLPSGGYDDAMFVDPPSEAQGLHCPICLLVLKEPHLLSCCGRHVCEVCIKHAQASNKSCPYCRTSRFSTLLNKEKKGKVLELKVYCFNSRNGCGWMGELGDAKRHLETKCVYVEQECPNGCGGKYLRHAMLLHQKEECMKRPLEAKVECQMEKMMKRFDGLEAEYKEKISTLESKLKEQEKIIVTLQKTLEEEKENISTLLEERAAELQKLSQMHSKTLNEALTACKSDIQRIDEQLKEVKSHVSGCETSLPISEGVMAYLTSTTSWRNLVKEVYGTGISLTLDQKSSPPVVQVKEVSRKEFRDAESRVHKVISSINEKVIRVSAENLNALKYLFYSSNGKNIIEELEESMEVGFEVGVISESGVDVTVYGMTMSTTYGAKEKIQSFIENQFGERKISIPEVDETRLSSILTFASSKHVEVNFISRFKVVLRGGQYDTQLVEDALRTANAAGGGQQPVVQNEDCCMM